MIKFGIPNKRNTGKVKVEKYPELAVLTILARPDKGGSYKFALNDKAIEVMGIACGKEGDCVSFAYQADEAYLGVTTNEELPAKVKRRVYDNKTFDAADHFNYIRDLKKVDPDLEVEFALTAVVLEDGGQTLYRLDKIEMIPTKVEVDAEVQPETEVEVKDELRDLTESDEEESL